MFENFLVFEDTEMLYFITFGSFVSNFLVEILNQHDGREGQLSGY
jgi:hypothetical protein